MKKFINIITILFTIKFLRFIYKPFGEISRLENDYFVDGKLVENNRAISGDIVHLDELQEKVNSLMMY